MFASTHFQDNGLTGSAEHRSFALRYLSDSWPRELALGYAASHRPEFSPVLRTGRLMLPGSPRDPLNCAIQFSTSFPPIHAPTRLPAVSVSLYSHKRFHRSARTNGYAGSI